MLFQPVAALIQIRFCAESLLLTPLAQQSQLSALALDLGARGFMAKPQPGG